MISIYLRGTIHTHDLGLAPNSYRYSGGLGSKLGFQACEVRQVTLDLMLGEPDQEAGADTVDGGNLAPP